MAHEHYVKTRATDGSQYDYPLSQCARDNPHLPVRHMTPEMLLERFGMAKVEAPLVPTPITKEDMDAEVRTRILAQASQATQINMTAAAAAGLLSAGETAAYKECLAWVSAMRAKGVDLLAAQDPDYQLDEKWPAPAATALTFVAAF